MGAYLSQPVTEKEIEEGDIHTNMKFAACAMQGWRKAMEDEHIAVALHPPRSIGGKVVSKIVDGGD